MSLTANELRHLVNRGYDGHVYYRSGARAYVGIVKEITDYDRELARVLTATASAIFGEEEISEFRVRKMALQAATKAQVLEHYDRIGVDYRTRKVIAPAERASDSASRQQVRAHRSAG